MALFEAYEDQYKSLINDINDKLDRVAKLQSQQPEKVQAEADSAQQDIEEAEEVVSKMEMELRGVKSDLKASLQTRVRKFKEDLGVCKDTLRASLRKALESSKRNELFGITEENGADHRININLAASVEQRSRMVAANDRLEGASDRLLESRKIARETELVGADIMQDLKQQRETLLHARGMLNEVDENLQGTKRIAKIMLRRMAQNKRTMYGVAVMVVICIIIIIASKFGGDSPPDGGSPGTKSIVEGDVNNTALSMSTP